MTMELRLDISRDLAKKWREGCAVLPSASSKQVRTGLDRAVIVDIFLSKFNMREILFTSNSFYIWLSIYFN
jgi:hypothetical protein